MVVTTLQLPLFGSAGLADAMVACAPHTTKITMYLRPHEATTAIGYKLLTTAPQRWAVRPSAGVVQVDGVGMIEIALLGNATEEEVIDGCFHDRLLLLSVPLDADEAAQVHELQTQNLKETISAMRLDNPCASRTRITVLTAPEPDMVFPGLFSFERNSSGTDDSHSPATWQGQSPAAGRERTDCDQTAASADGLEASGSGHSLQSLSRSVGSPLLSPRLSVAERVAILQKRVRDETTPLLDAQQWPDDVVQNELACPHGDGDRGGDGDSDGDSHGADSSSGDNHGPHCRSLVGSPRDSVVRTVFALLATASGSLKLQFAEACESVLLAPLEELAPWLKWKVYDILLALLLIRLSKRFKWAQWLQELGC